MFDRHYPGGTNLLAKYIRSGSDDAQTNVPVSFRIPESVAVEAEELADEFNIPKSQLIRDCFLAGYSDLCSAWRQAQENGS